MNSTTAQLVIGDALAASLIKLRNFTPADFAKYHPGGALGKKLLLQVKHIIKSENKPQVSLDSSISKVIVEISEKRLAVTAVLDQENLVGIVTDGDLRRMLQQNDNINDFTAKDIMSPNPKTIDANEHVSKALSILEDNSITQLIVTDQNKYIGVIHLHDILKEAIV